MNIIHLYGEKSTLNDPLYRKYSLQASLKVLLAFRFCKPMN